jgi:hypothetical protein
MHRLILLALRAGSPVAAEEDAPETVTLDAFSIWEATGATTLVGPDTEMSAGKLSGPYFIETGEGPVPAGSIVCVGSLEASSATGAQSGSARGRLVAGDGAVAFGRSTCEGWRIVGCVGRFVLDVGEGRLGSLAGEGPIVIRGYETEWIATASGAVAEHALGVASWKGFTRSGAAAR